MTTRKALGQHFLVHGPSIRHIVDAAGIGPGDLVIEIGPGRGALTRPLIERAARVIAIELDRSLCASLQMQFSDLQRFHLINADVQKIDLSALVRESGWDRAILVGNLPYRITGALMRQITDARTAWSRAVIMVQREVARRIAAQPGGKDFGVLSAIVQVRCVPGLLFDLPPGHFAPPPQVYSSVLRLDFEAPPSHCIEDEARFLQVVRMAFQQRRKMLHNTLRPLVQNDETALQALLDMAGVDGRLRPEAVSIDAFERICQALKTRV